MNLKIDFTTTAMPRPDLVDRTFYSFSKNLIGIDLKQQDLYINIDPLPDCKSQVLREHVVKICKKYFKNVNYSMPDTANFSEAINRVWGGAQSELIFNIEDDWELVRPINITALLEAFQNCDTLYQVVLRAYTYRYPACCLSPSLLHKRFYKKIAGKLHSNLNPETQIHSRRDFGIFIPNKDNCCDVGKYLIVYPRDTQNPRYIVVKDIGREWITKSKYIKPQEFNISDRRHKKKCYFTSWKTK